MHRVRPLSTCPGLPTSLLTFPGVQWFLPLCYIPELKALLWRYKTIQVFSTLQLHSKGTVNEKAMQFRQFKWGSRRACYCSAGNSPEWPWLNSWEKKLVWSDLSWNQDENGRRKRLDSPLWKSKLRLVRDYRKGMCLHSQLLVKFLVLQKHFSRWL